MLTELPSRLAAQPVRSHQTATFQPAELEPGVAVAAVVERKTVAAPAAFAVQAVY